MDGSIRLARDHLVRRAVVEQFEHLPAANIEQFRARAFRDEKIRGSLIVHPNLLSDHARPWLCLCIAVIVTDDVILADIWTGPHFDEYHGNAPRIFDTMLRTDRLLADHRHECEYS